MHPYRLALIGFGNVGQGFAHQTLCAHGDALAAQYGAKFQIAAVNALTKGNLYNPARGRVHTSVRATRLPLSHPLASVSGATNALTYTTDLLGEGTLVDPGAGRVETGCALLSDLLAIHRASKRVI